MKIVNCKDIEANKVAEAGAKGVTIRWLISQEDGAPNFAMRLFEVEPGGYTPYHQHQWEHEVFILEGKGNLILEDKTLPLNKSDAIFVPGEKNHQFKNESQENLVFLCIVPNQM